MAARSAIINVITKACYKAARPLVRDFGEVRKTPSLAQRAW